MLARARCFRVGRGWQRSRGHARQPCTHCCGCGCLVLLQEAAAGPGCCCQHIIPGHWQHQHGEPAEPAASISAAQVAEARQQGDGCSSKAPRTGEQWVPVPASAATSLGCSDTCDAPLWCNILLTPQRCNILLSTNRAHEHHAIVVLCRWPRAALQQRLHPAVVQAHHLTRQQWH